MADEVIERDKPNGPVVAVLLAGGIGAATMGIVTTLAAASGAFAQALAWIPAVGPLTGKAIVSVIVFIVAWIVLHLMFRGKELNFNRYAVIAYVLLAIGLLGTFPPFFELFAGE